MIALGVIDAVVLRELLRLGGIHGNHSSASRQSVRGRRPGLRGFLLTCPQAARKDRPLARADTTLGDRSATFRRMLPHRHWLPRLTFALVIAFGAVAPTHSRAEPDDHGPTATDRFISHRFTLEAHTPERVQLAVHFGLLQPVVLHGFNAAVDVRWKRLIFTYSHGVSLNFTPYLRQSERDAGLRVVAPFSTGGGIGIVLIDELYVLLDVKYHRFDLSLGTEHPSYETLTVGGEIGWRFFLWKGFYLSPVLRYWPNVWTSAPKGGVPLNNGALVHRPLVQGTDGLFGNLLIGWAFNL